MYTKSAARPACMAPVDGDALTWTTQAAQACAALTRQQPARETSSQNQHQSSRSIFDLARAPARNQSHQFGQFERSRTCDELESNMRPARSKHSFFGAAAAGSQTSLVTRNASATPTNQASSSSSADDDHDDEPDEELRALRRSSQQQQQQQDAKASKKRKQRVKSSQQELQLSLLERLCVLLWRATCVACLLLSLNLLVYVWPLDERFEFEAKVAPLKPRPSFEGALAIDDKLDGAQKLWEGQFHAPESMAWTGDKRAFFTGVEGGFILFVEPYAERWSVAARLNARHSVADLTQGVAFVAGGEAAGESGREPERERERLPERPAGSAAPLTPFCAHDVELYGARAEFEPSLVELSRCSRPLGIRLAPDESRLYVMDPLSGLYRVELAANLSAALADRSRALAQLNQVSRLLDLSFNQVAAGAELPAAERRARPDQLYFGDDIAVQWGAASDGALDTIFMSDCSRRWTLRYLLWLMLENDDSGRLLVFEPGARRLRELDAVVPVRLARGSAGSPPLLDERRLSFPNGLELTADGGALLVSDLNNRRILKHHLRGPRARSTELLLHTPGFNDNIRRGLDLPDGTPTYWYACGCAVGDARWETFELMNGWPRLKRLALRWLHLAGRSLQRLARSLNSTRLADWGLLLDSGWLKLDPYCTHSLVGQFDESGRLLRSLHAPSFGSHFKLLSEAHQVPLWPAAHSAWAPPPAASNSSRANDTQPAAANQPRKSALWLGSVYYSYLGRLELAD